MIYTPVAPCRAFAGQSLTANQTKSFQLSGNGSFAAQGGPAGGCGVPAYAKAVSITLTAPASSANAYITAFATGSARPNTNLVVPTTGSYGVASTIVRLGSTGLISVHATKTTTVYGDVTGYYEPQLWAAVNHLGGLISSSGRINSISKGGTGIYYISFDRDLSTCAATITSSDAARVTSAFLQPNYVTVNIYSTSNISVDGNFVIHVMC